MNKKGFVLLAAIVFIIILCLSGGDGAPEDLNGAINDTNFNEKIKTAHVFANGMHTFTGEINLPTPCHVLTHKVIVAQSFPEKVTIAFEKRNEIGSCIQMITPEPFVVSFEASSEAIIKITLDGENLPFEVIEVEMPEDETKNDDEENATSTEEGFSAVEKIDFYSCVQDFDCVSVKEECCGCTAGGLATAISKDLENEWQKKLNCEEIMCIMVMSDHPSCFQEPKCVEGRCILVDTIE